MKRILIVEDDAKYKVRFRQWSQEMGYEVIEASSAQEGLDLFLKSQPDLVVTDFGLIGRWSGNDLAKKIKEARKVPIAGITGGSKESFDSRAIDISETKAITREAYRTLISCLSGSNPREEYAKATAESRAVGSGEKSLVYATSVLFQGYYLGKALTEGAKEVILDGKLILSKEQMKEIKRFTKRNKKGIDPAEVFGMFQTGKMNCKEVYEIACRIKPGLSEDRRFGSIFEKLSKSDYTFSIEDAAYAAETLGRLEEEGK